jgi:hypothetical protein
MQEGGNGMTIHWGPDNPFGLGLSDTGQPGTGPDPDETALLLRRVRDGLLGKPAENGSDEGRAA